MGSDWCSLAGLPLHQGPHDSLSAHSAYRQNEWLAHTSPLSDSTDGLYSVFAALALGLGEGASKEGELSGSGA